MECDAILVIWLVNRQKGRYYIADGILSDELFSTFFDVL